MKVFILLALVGLSAFGSTELLLAARKGDTETVKQCLERGDNIEAKNNCFYTPLLFAVRYGQVETVRLLLAYGANVHQRTYYGLSVFNLSKSKEIDEALILAGADYSSNFSSVMQSIEQDPDAFLAAHIRALILEKNIDNKDLILEAAKFWMLEGEKEKSLEVLELSRDTSSLSDQQLARLLACVIKKF